MVDGRVFQWLSEVILLFSHLAIASTSLSTINASEAYRNNAIAIAFCCAACHPIHRRCIVIVIMSVLSCIHRPYFELAAKTTHIDPLVAVAVVVVVVVIIIIIIIIIITIIINYDTLRNKQTTRSVGEQCILRRRWYREIDF